MTDFKKENRDVCEEQNYKVLFQQFGQQLYQFLYYKFNNEDLARDAMQEAFILLWENCKKVSFDRAKSYVFTIGRNKAIDVIRKEKMHLIISEDSKLEADETTEENSDQLKRMKEIVAKMPEGSREAFLMNRISGMTYTEIAEDLSISVKAVEKRMSIALKVVRDELSKK